MPKDANLLTLLKQELVEAAFQGNIQRLRQKLADGADANLQGPDACPLLHYAVIGGQAKVVTLLLDAGADVNAKTKDGVTPLISAVEWGYAEVVELLVANNADLSAQDQYGRTALTVASDLSHGKIVSVLEAAGTPPGPKRDATHNSLNKDENHEN